VPSDHGQSLPSYRSVGFRGSGALFDLVSDLLCLLSIVLRLLSSLAGEEVGHKCSGGNTHQA
jgi:hypothetical protein